VLACSGSTRGTRPDSGRRRGSGHANTVVRVGSRRCNGRRGGSRAAACGLALQWRRRVRERWRDSRLIRSRRGIGRSCFELRLDGDGRSGPQPPAV
jgi:hypothetical protein